MKKITYIKYSLTIIGLSLVISGFRWLTSSEPWLLDQLANEERLGITFQELFSIEGNETLGGYLKQIYRFLGIYVLGIGLFVISFSKNKLLQTNILRVRVLLVLGVLLFSNIVLAYTWIPSSHFIYLMWGSIGLYLFSLYNHFKL